MHSAIGGELASESRHQARDGAGTASTEATATIYEAANWDNATFENVICSLDTTTTTGLFVTITSSKWFRFPPCLAALTALGSIGCNGCQTPNFTVLPPGLSTLTLSGLKGSWTKADSGLVSPTDAAANDFDWSWLPSLPNLIMLGLTSGPLTGTLPNNLSHAKLQQLILFSNQFTGTISPDFFVKFPSLLTINVAYNQLVGTIPYYRLETVVSFGFHENKFTHWPPFVTNTTVGFRAPTTMNYVHVGGNELVQIPLDSDLQAMTSLATFNVSANPGLAIPFPRLLSPTLPRTGSILMTIIGFGCQFTGSLPEIPDVHVAAYNATLQVLTFRFDNNQLTGSIPRSWAGLSIDYLDLRGNPGLNGTLAAIDSNGMVVSQFVKNTRVLYLGPSEFTGPMFNITSMSQLFVLSVNGLGIDACASTANANTSEVLFPRTLSNCTLMNTTADSCDWAYPKNCLVRPYPDPSAQAPVTEPVFEPSTTAPTAATTPVTAPMTCPMPPPGPTFSCIGNRWVSDTSVTSPVITFPPASTTVINGDLNTSSIVIVSIGTTINVTGCVVSSEGSSPPITLTLTRQDLEKILKNGGTLTSLLIQQSPSCGSLATSVLSVDTKSIDSCRTIKVDKIASSSGLSAVLTVNSSKCNVWWIVLVSVLFVVAIVAVIVIMVLYKLHMKASNEEAMSQLKQR